MPTNKIRHTLKMTFLTLRVSCWSGSFSGSYGCRGPFTQLTATIMKANLANEQRFQGVQSRVVSWTKEHQTSHMLWAAF